MKKWAEIKMPNAKLNITEFGWNSGPTCGKFVVGEANQAIYNLRAWLVAARYGTNKAFNYGTHNSGPAEEQYCTTGLTEDDNNDGILGKIEQKANLFHSKT